MIANFEIERPALKGLLDGCNGGPQELHEWCIGKSDVILALSLRSVSFDDTKVREVIQEEVEKRRDRKRLLVAFIAAVLLLIIDLVGLN
jgi:hypothetical protein